MIQLIGVLLSMGFIGLVLLAGCILIGVLLLKALLASIESVSNSIRR